MDRCDMDQLGPEVIIIINVILYFLPHWYFIPRGVKTKQIGEMS